MSNEYRPPIHVALVRHGSLIGNRDVAFIAEAVRLQLIDAAAAWGLEPPGCAVYDVGDVPGGSGRIAQIHLVPTDGDPEALGSHTKIGDSIVGDVDLSQSGSDVSTVVSHEALEIFGNADLDRWVPGPGGLEYAVELCDPVEAQSYEQGATVMDETRGIMVSDFIYPAWLGLQNAGAGRLWSTTDTHFLEHMATLDPLPPFTIAPGGYAIAADSDGNIRYLAAAGGAMFPARKLLPTSRTARIISKGRR
jgi:hypothetical protein